MHIDEQATSRTRARYERIARFYDAMEILAEKRYEHWRPQLWSQVQGPNVLEVGVGTGKNMPFYPQIIEVTGIDLTPGMLARARERARTLKLKVNLEQGDVQDMAFSDAVFDSVVATFVFCSVPNPRLGLNEVARVLKPGGRLLLLEHVRSVNSLVGTLMDVMNPVVVRMIGANINRRTVETIDQSDLQLEHVTDMGLNSIFKLIVATKQ